jgi:hypothetical protein
MVLDLTAVVFRRGKAIAHYYDTTTRKQYVLAGYADPIKAAQLLEEAVKDDGYVPGVGDDIRGYPTETPTTSP